MSSSDVYGINNKKGCTLFKEKLFKQPLRNVFLLNLLNENHSNKPFT